MTRESKRSYVVMGREESVHCEGLGEGVGTLGGRAVELHTPGTVKTLTGGRRRPFIILGWLGWQPAPAPKRIRSCLLRRNSRLQEIKTAAAVSGSDRQVLQRIDRRFVILVEKLKLPYLQQFVAKNCAM